MTDRFETMRKLSGQDKEELLEHILQEIVSDIEVNGDEHEAYLGLQVLGVRSILDLMHVDESVVSYIQIPDYPDDWKKGDEIPIVKKEIAWADSHRIVSLKWFCNWIQENARKMDLTLAEWKAQLTYEEYSEFIMREYPYLDKRSYSPPSQPPSTPLKAFEHNKTFIAQETCCITITVRFFN